MPRARASAIPDHLNHVCTEVMNAQENAVYISFTGQIRIFRLTLPNAMKLIVKLNRLQPVPVFILRRLIEVPYKQYLIEVN
jgi:hypothetical protein